MLNDEQNNNEDLTEKLSNRYKSILEILSTEKDGEDFELSDRQAETEQTLKERETDRQGKEKFYELRSKWSVYLAILLFIMVGFQIILIFLIGLGWLNYSLYENFLYTVLVESFLQITGMCILVVKFLFNKIK